MPKTEVLFYQEAGGRSPVVEWIEHLRRTDVDAYVKCRAVIRRLQELGHELRRPTADLLRDGIYELRARKGVVPATDIERAMRLRTLFEADPERHAYTVRE